VSIPAGGNRARQGISIELNTSKTLQLAMQLSPIHPHLAQSERPYMRKARTHLCCDPVWDWDEESDCQTHCNCLESWNDLDTLRFA
jgi:hypothetical protein